MNVRNENNLKSLDPDKMDGTEVLKSFCKNGFESDMATAALALGRETKDLEKMLNQEITVDDDLIVKMQSIAQERNFSI